jgi:hypothetical protein
MIFLSDCKVREAGNCEAPLLLLENLLNTDGPIEFFRLADSVIKYYGERKIPYQAIARDVNKLRALGAVRNHYERNCSRQTYLPRRDCA